MLATARDIISRLQGHISNTLSSVRKVPNVLKLSVYKMLYNQYSYYNQISTRFLVKMCPRDHVRVSRKPLAPGMSGTKLRIRLLETTSCFKFTRSTTIPTPSTGATCLLNCTSGVLDSLSLQLTRIAWLPSHTCSAQSRRGSGR
jgi:hypothetical protein